jgi:phage gp29-like protein
LTKGYFVATDIDMHGKDLFFSWAFKAKLLLANPQGVGRAWHDPLTIPKMAEAEKFLTFIRREQENTRIRAAAKEAKNKPLSNQAKIKVAEKDNTTQGRLTRIEAKIDMLLEKWQLAK